MLRAIILGLAAALPGCMTPKLYELEKMIVYQPVVTEPQLGPKTWPKDSRTPEGIEDVKIVVYSDDPKFGGESIHGWFAEAKNPRAVVLYCHGNAGNIHNCADVLKVFRDQLSVTILAFDYRGYGRSSSCDDKCEGYFCRDAAKAREWLAKRTGVAEKDIVLYGYSLGGAIAVDLAAREGFGLTIPPRGLILDRTFTSIPDVADSHVPLLPVGWLLESQYDSLKKIKNYHGPLLQLHGDKDRVVPFDLGLKLFHAANDPKKFVRVPGGGHNDPLTPNAIAALHNYIETLNSPPTIRCGSCDALKMDPLNTLPVR